MNEFILKAECVAITTNIEEQKIFVLSLEEQRLVLPILDITKDNIESIDKNVIQNMKKFLMTNDLELAPQIIKIYPNKDSSTLHIVYAFLIKENIRHFDSHWINFDYNNPKIEHSDLIFEVVQKLK